MNPHTSTAGTPIVAAPVLMRRARRRTPRVRFTSLADTAVGSTSAYILSAALLVAVPILTETRSLQAQELDECVECVDLDDNQHYTFPFWVPTSGWGWGDGLHPDNEPDLCLWVHGLCVFVPRGGGKTFTAHELTHEISDAVAKGDLATLAEYVSMPSVTVFDDRSAIQVWNCDGETIAGHVAVEQDMLGAIKAIAAELGDHPTQSP